MMQRLSATVVEPLNTEAFLVSIASLPPEVLSLIFSFLPNVTSDPFNSDFSDLANALLVCHHWKEVGQAPVLWAKSKLMVTSTEVLADFCEGNVPARFDLVQSLEITNIVIHMPVHQLEKRLSREDSYIENISIFPLTMVTVSTLFEKIKKTGWGQSNLFPMITPKIRVVRARTVYREHYVHMAFLEELVHKMATGQITLRMLDLRGLEMNLVGLDGSGTVREKLTRTGAELICDEEHFLQEKCRILSKKNPP